MRVFVAGATGGLGRRLVRQLTAKCHEVVGPRAERGEREAVRNLGGMTFATASTRTSNAKIRKDFAWSPHYPTHGEGTRRVADVWKAEGFPPKS